ncbi:MAG: M20/M25/M40 family metallo-hydrolase [Myxococcota bacterium]
MANQRVATLIADRLHTLGYAVTWQGPLRNVVARPPGHPASEPLMLVGAHYDSVPGSPGADDNASAIAVMLAVAEAMARCGSRPVGLVAFNSEEDGLEGSRDFVAWARRTGQAIAGIHVLEMVGYTAPHQRLPAGLSVAGVERGDFVAVVGAGRSRSLLHQVMDTADREPVAPAAVGLYVGRHPRLVPAVFHRSDHSPFWRAGLPALMWTDTAQFRNPHYHQPTDTPQTLDYGFMHRVTGLLLATLGTARVDGASEGEDPDATATRSPSGTLARS